MDQLAAAIEDHTYNMNPGYLPYRDSIAPWPLALTGEELAYHLTINTFEHLSDVAECGVPIYQSANYEEDYRAKRGVIAKYNTLDGTNPMKVILGPGAHCQWCNEYTPVNAKADSDFRIDTEELRWFDYWLKGVDNGIMEEPPIYYATYQTPEDKQWRFAWQWPLPTDTQMKFYLGEEVEGNNDLSDFDGSLSTTAPTAKYAKDDYLLDYDASKIGGIPNASGVIVSATEPDLSIARNTNAMTYTTAPLDADMNITGDPVVNLWVSSTATDGDFLAFIYDVAPDGSLTQIPGSEGWAAESLT